MITEGKNSIFLGGQAWLVEEDRELAWAEHHIVRNAAMQHILGRFVEGEQPNDNGHIFASKELETAQRTVINSPLNLLHHPHYIVGSFIASEMVYPVAATAGIEAPANPIMEALSGFWRYYFPQEFKEVQKAHADGSLFYSMEAVCKTVRCAAVCGETYDYAGRFSESYCEHLNQPGAKRNLNEPHFMGGALILPPAKPGWRGAGITEMSALVERHEAEASRIYESLKAELPHLDSQTWEEMMMSVVMQAYSDTAPYGAGPASERKARTSVSRITTWPKIDTPEALGDAIKGLTKVRPEDQPKMKAHIIRRAKALGLTPMIPGGWST